MAPRPSQFRHSVSSVVPSPSVTVMVPEPFSQNRQGTEPVAWQGKQFCGGTIPGSQSGMEGGS